MRIAMISTPFVRVPPVGYGGTELIVYELAEGFVERDHDVTVFTTGGSRTRARTRALYDHPVWPPDSLTELNHVSWAFREILEDGEYDIVHTHSAAGVPFGSYLDAPLVCTLHSERTESLAELYRNHADVQYVAISHDQARRCGPFDRCDVIHHGVSPEPYRGRSEASDYVCFLGRLSPIKGPHTAIDVAARAGVNIRVAGEVHPPDRTFADEEILPRLDLPHVEFLGPIGLEAKARLLRGARALLFPIEWNEPFGLVLIEAMLAGCPVVAFARGSVPELVDPGVTGFVAEGAEHMAEIVRPGGVLDTFDREACRMRAVERFDRLRMVAEHERLYRRLLSGRAERYDRAVRDERGSRRLGT